MENSITIHAPTCVLYGVDRERLEACVIHKANLAKIKIKIFWNCENGDYIRTAAISILSTVNDPDGEIENTLRQIVLSCFRELQAKQTPQSSIES